MKKIKRHIPKSKKVVTPLPIVYKVGKKHYEVAPYLDLKRKEQVWGIEVVGIWWKKIHEGHGSWYLAQECGSEELKLPDVRKLVLLRNYIADFNLTVHLLQVYGLKAEGLEISNYQGFYWADDISQSCGVYIGTDYSVVRDKNDFGHIRLVRNPY